MNPASYRLLGPARCLGPARLAGPAWDRLLGPVNG